MLSRWLKLRVEAPGAFYALTQNVAPTSKGLGAWGRGVFMRTNRTPDEWDKWCRARERIIRELKEYYRVCTRGELPPQLIELSKKLDQELLEKQGQQDHPAAITGR